jgi:hypothetical protein
LRSRTAGTRDQHSEELIGWRQREMLKKVEERGFESPPGCACEVGSSIYIAHAVITMTYVYKMLSEMFQTSLTIRAKIMLLQNVNRRVARSCGVPKKPKPWHREVGQSW